LSAAVALVSAPEGLATGVLEVDLLVLDADAGAEERVAMAIL